MTTTPTTRPTETKTYPHNFANPFSEFRHEMDTLFDRFFATRPAFDFRLPVREDFATKKNFVKGMMVPEIDIHETTKNIRLKAELPGMEKDDIYLSLQEGVLTLEGEKKFETESEEEESQVVECRYGRFERTFTLPSSVDQGKIRAKFKNGVLTVWMPKISEKKWPKQKIEIS